MLLFLLLSFWLNVSQTTIKSEKLDCMTLKGEGLNLTVVLLSVLAEVVLLSLMPRTEQHSTTLYVLSESLSTTHCQPCVYGNVQLFRKNTPVKKWDLKIK